MTSSKRTVAHGFSERLRGRQNRSRTYSYSQLVHNKKLSNLCQDGWSQLLAIILYYCFRALKTQRKEEEGIVKIGYIIQWDDFNFVQQLKTNRYFQDLIDFCLNLRSRMPECASKAARYFFVVYLSCTNLRFFLSFLLSGLSFLLLYTVFHSFLICSNTRNPKMILPCLS